MSSTPAESFDLLLACASTSIQKIHERSLTWKSVSCATLSVEATGCYACKQQTKEFSSCVLHRIVQETSAIFVQVYEAEEATLARALQRQAQEAKP